MSRQSTVQTGVMMNYQPKQCTTLRENPQNDQIICIVWSPQDNVDKMSDFLKAHLKHSTVNQKKQDTPPVDIGAWLAGSSIMLCKLVLKPRCFFSRQKAPKYGKPSHTQKNGFD